MRALIILIIYTFLVGCGPQYVEVKPGADGVAVVENINEEKCELKGTNTVRITGYAERLPEYIQRDLLQLSKNAAFDMGANTIKMYEQFEKGRGTQSATFEAYLCN